MNTNLAYLSHNTSIYLVYSEHTELKDVKNKVICIAMCMYLVFLFATLATLRSVKIIPFGNFWCALLLTGMQNIAGNGKTVTQVLYRVANRRMHSHLLPQLPTSVTEHTVAIFGNDSVQLLLPLSCNIRHAANSCRFWPLIEAKYCQRWQKR